MKNYWTYAKIGLCVLLLLFIVLNLSGDKISETDIDSLTKNVVKAAELEGAQQAESRMVKRFYGLNPKDYEGAVLYAPEDNMDAHELLIVKLSDVSQQKDVREAIEERLDVQMKSFDGYGAEQTALLKAHVLQIEGNYVFYMVGEHAREAQKAFEDSL